jgi:hypothetical protein
LCNPDATKKYGSRADFFRSTAEAMVNPNTDWATKYPLQASKTRENEIELRTEVLMTLHCYLPSPSQQKPASQSLLKH